MGYRSDVRVVTSKEGFSVLSEFVKNYLANESGDYNLLENIDLMVENKEQCYFGWNCLKWYDGFSEVDAIMEGLNKLEEKDYSFRFSRLGESYDDYEEMSNDGEKDKNIYLEYPNLLRAFDDDYMEQNIQDIQINEIEKNVENIDI